MNVEVSEIGLYDAGSHLSFFGFSIGMIIASLQLSGVLPSFQETKLNSKIPPFKFKGYQAPINKIRPGDTNAGGLCIYVKNDIQFKEKQIYLEPTVEVAAVTLFGKEETFTIYNYYAKNEYVNKYGSYEKNIQKR